MRKQEHKEMYSSEGVEKGRKRMGGQSYYEWRKEKGRKTIT